MVASFRFVVVAVLALVASPSAVPAQSVLTAAFDSAAQAPWWDTGPGDVVENDFALGLTYSPVCLSLDRFPEGGGSAPGPGPAAPCSYGAGLRFEAAHWFNARLAFRMAVDGAWSWDVRRFGASGRAWRFRRYGLDLGVRFGRALGAVRPWVDAGAVFGSAAAFASDPVRIRAESPVFEGSHSALDEVFGLEPFRAGVWAAAGAGVDLWSPYGLRAAVRRSWPLFGPPHGSPYLSGAGFVWEVGPLVRF